MLFSIFNFIFLVSLTIAPEAPVSMTHDLFVNNIVSEYDYESKHLSYTKNKYTINLLKITNMTNKIKVKGSIRNINRLKDQFGTLIS
jgi:hypothetical protein